MAPGTETDLTSPDRWSLWFGVLQWLFTIALAITVWLRKPGEDAGKAVAELRDDIDTRLQLHDQALTRLETELRHMPDEKALAEVRAAVLVNREHTDSIARGVASMQVQLNRIEDFLRAGK